MKFRTTLSGYFQSQPLFFDGDLQKKPNIRKCMEQPWQQTKAELWDEVTDTLCNLDFIQAKAVAKKTYDLVKDFNDVLEVIPDNAENIRQEKARQDRMEKYARDLIACAEGKISRFELDVPESIIPWSQEKIDDETERIKTRPTRLDSLKDFINFLGQEAGNLQNFAHEFSYFTYQQAWNYAAGGPVGNIAEKASVEVYRYLLIRNQFTRPPWNPKPQILNKLKGHENLVSSVCITPDGKLAFSGSSDQICILWDLSTGQAIQILKGHSGRINSVAITPNAKLALSGSCDKTCIVWDLNTGLPVQTLEGHTSVIRTVAITPDGKRAISGSDDKTCILWDIDTAQPVKILTGHIESVDTVAITPDGKRAITGSNDKTCILWNLDTGLQIKTLSGHTEFVTSISITPDGKQAISGSADKTCILWDLNTGLPVKTLKGHDNLVLSVAISPDGKSVVSAPGGGPLIVWDLKTGLPIQTLIGHTNMVSTVAITPDGNKAISGSWDTTCILWNLSTGRGINTHEVHTSTVNAFAITTDWKKAVTSSLDYTCKIWNLNTGLQEKTLKGHSSFVMAIAITPDGKRAVTGALDNSCMSWRLDTCLPLQILKGHIGSIHVIVITPDGKKAITGASDNTCILWNLVTGQQLQIFKGHTGSVTVIAITPDGKRIITGSEDKTCILWNLDTGQQLLTFKGHDSPVNAIAITPDGKRAFSGSFTDKTCIFWDINTGQSLQIFGRYYGWGNAIAITPDGKRVITGSGWFTCTLWDINSGKDLACFITNSHIQSVVYSPKGISLVCKSGSVIFLNGNKELFCLSIPITTVHHIWDFHQYQELSADCPLCGHRFSPPVSVLVTIEEITKKASLKPEQSPCLELPDDAWEHPGLLGECPNCREKLKYNPFFGSEIREINEHHPMMELSISFQKKLNEAENEFKAENWLVAYNLYLSLVQQGQFDENYLRFNMAICLLNTLTTNNPLTVNKINNLIKMLQDKSANEKAQFVADKLKERIELIHKEESEQSKAQKPWWKKIL